jgi:hypothetical protein
VFSGAVDYFGGMQGRGETVRHAELKRLTLEWAQRNGFTLCATEVRVPRSGYRADVAACRRGGERRTAVFECKQARADLLKDAHAEGATRQKIAELIERRRSIEELLTVHRPDLRRGEAFWPEFDTWDFSQAEHATYHRVLKELATNQRRIMRGTKFARMLRYRCADFLYLVVEDDIFAEAEIPAGWGLLIKRGTELVTSRTPAPLASEEPQRIALLEQIALAGTRAINRAAGLTFSDDGWTSGEMPKT